MRTVVYSFFVVFGLMLAPRVQADTRVEDVSELFEQGVEYVARGYYTLAVEVLERAVAANADHAQANLILADHIVIDERGVRYASEESNARALKLHQHVLELEPDLPAAHNNLAWLLVQSHGDSGMAVEHAEKANSLRPNELAYMDTLAASYCAALRHQEARKVLVAALALAPETPYLLRRKKRICSKEPIREEPVPTEASP